jgi:hypothetical protein
MERILKILALAICFVTTPAAWAAAKAGDILLAQGAAFVRNATGVERAAAVGMAVESGETLVTRDGRLQVKFTDGGMTSLQPESQFAITDYRFAGEGKGDESAVFKLIKGGFRTITGLVGKREKSAYRVDSVVATIGVRGTAYQAVLCAASCKQPDGLYVRTGEGTIFVKNAAGEIDVGKGQSAFVASANTAPQRTTTAPPMTARVTTSAPPTVAGVGTTEFAPGTILSATPQNSVTQITQGGIALAASGTGSGTVTSNFFPGFSGSTSGAGSGAGSSNNMPAGSLVGAYMNGGSIMGCVVSANGGIASALFSTPPVNVGSNGDLYWGRWTNTTLTLYAGLGGYYANGSMTIPATSSIHYMLGTTVPTVFPTTATFNFVGGTPSTDAAGGVGLGITSGQLQANFSSNYVSGNFTVTHNNSYAVSAYMPMGSTKAVFGTEHGGGGSININGSPVSLSGNSVNGFFVGSPSPTGAGLSYTINNSIVGVGAFR